MWDLRLGAFGLELRVFRGSGFRVKGFRVCWGVQKTSGIERKHAASKSRLVEMGAWLKETTGGEFRVYRASTRLLYGR